MDAASNSRPRALLVQYSANPGGSTISGLMVARSLIADGWDVDVAFGFDGPYRKHYADLGCGVHVVPHENWFRGGSWWRTLRRLGGQYRAVRRLRRLMRELGPRLVYVNTLASAAAALAARPNCEIVLHIRELFDDVGGELSEPAFGGKARLRAWIARHPNVQIVVPSKAVVDNVLGDQLAPRVHIIPNAVEQTFEITAQTRPQARRAMDIADQTLLIGIPGTLRPAKGHEFFLRAAADLLREIPHCRVLITGYGDAAYRRRLDELVATLGIASQVGFTGTIERMNEFCAACDIICVPSRAESFGRTVIEAFVAGTAVIATAVGGIPEIIEDGQTSLLVPYGDAAKLQAALRRLIDDPELRQRLASIAQRKAQREYREEGYHRRIAQLVAPLKNPASENQLRCSAPGVCTP